MTEVRQCPECGAELTADTSLEDLCPRCLLKLGLDSQHDTRISQIRTAPDPKAEKLPVAGQHFGPYGIVGLLGEGGMGVVYLAEQEQPIRRMVALKLIKLGMDTQEIIARFESERQALAMMDHPNIAKVFDAGTSEQGRPYFVMEYVAGIPITDYCDKHRLSNRERLELFMRVCHAIQHAHQKGIIHRDIKPSNVLVSIQDNHPFPKVIDFGVSKATNQRLTEKTVFTQRGLLIGTPEYMSPEQAEMGVLDVDTRTDIYSLGVLLYELLVGALPFDPQMLRRVGYDEIRRIIREEEPPKPTTRLHSLGATSAEVAKRRHTDVVSLQKQLRDDLDWITMKALEKDRTYRYPSASEFAADIARHLNDEPVVASPPSAIYRFRKFVKKNKRPVATLLAVLVCLMLGFVVSTVLYFRVQEAKDGAERQRSVAQRQSYAANLTTANLHLRFNEAAEAKRRLLMCVPSLRGWEWRHLHFTSDSSLATLYAQGDFSHFPFLSSSFAFSPDRTRIFWNTEHTLQSWDAATNLPIVTVGGFGSIIAISLTASRIVSTNPRGSEERDYTLRVFDPVSGKLITNLVGHNKEAKCAAFSPDDNRVVSGSMDGMLRLWDAASGKAVASISGHKDSIDCVAFSPDGTRIVTGSHDKTLHVWDALSGKSLATLTGHEAVTSVAFSPDGRRIVSASRDKTARVWDAVSGKIILILTGHDGPVYSVAFSPDGTKIASGSEDKTVRVWDSISGEEIAKLIGHDGYVISVAFNTDGTRILSADQFGAHVRLWDLRTNGGFTLLGRLDGNVTSVTFSPDARHIASGSDKVVRVWDSESGRLVSTITGHDAKVTSVAFSPDGTRIISGSEDKTARVWDAISGKAMATLTHNDKVASVAFSPDGTKIASGSWDKAVRVWDAASGKTITTMTLVDPVNCVVFSPDGNQVLSGSGDMSRYPANDATVRIWDAFSGKPLVTMSWEKRAPAVGSVAFSPDGKHVVSHSWDRTVRVWDALSGKSLATLAGHQSLVSSVAFSPDGRRIISGSWDQTVWVWDAISYEPLLNLHGFMGEVLSVAFSPDGTRIVAGSSDKTVRVWDTRSAYHPEAQSLVDSLFKELIFASDVIRRLRSDAALDDSLREAALQLVLARGDNPRQLNNDSWDVVKSPGGNIEAYRLALRQAQVAGRLAPWEWTFLNTLGAAQYRVRAYEDAIATLIRAAELHGSPSPYGMAFIAMAHNKLGQPEKVQAHLGQLRAMMQDPKWSEDTESKDLFREAESLIFGPGGANGKKR